MGTNESPSPLPGVKPPNPPPITHFLFAFLHIRVCLNADGIKRLLLPPSISVFLFYLLLQVEGICGMRALLDCPAAAWTNTSPSVIPVSA